MQVDRQVVYVSGAVRWREECVRRFMIMIGEAKYYHPISSVLFPPVSLSSLTTQLAFFLWSLLLALRKCLFVLAVQQDNPQNYIFVTATKKNRNGMCNKNRMQTQTIFLCLECIYPTTEAKRKSKSSLRMVKVNFSPEREREIEPH